MSFSLLSLFIPTFFLVSILPGICMTLALSLGMSIGVRRSLNMMWGELLGVGLVASITALGAATLMTNYPQIFIGLKLIGGIYLCWLGYNLFTSKGKLAINQSSPEIQQNSRLKLAANGFITAIANPKAWTFFATILPRFINPNHPSVPQIISLVITILVIEFCCLLIYANGGKLLQQYLMRKNRINLMNKLAGSMIIIIGLWLVIRP